MVLIIKCWRVEQESGRPRRNVQLVVMVTFIRVMSINQGKRPVFVPSCLFAVAELLEFKASPVCIKNVIPKGSEYSLSRLNQAAIALHVLSCLIFF